MSQNDTGGQVEGVGVLDLLVAGAESWKLILFGSLLAGVAAFILAIQLLPPYDASTLLRLSQVELERVNVRFIDAVHRTISGLTAETEVTEVERQTLNAKFYVRADATSDPSRLGVLADTPQEAQALLAAAISVLDSIFPEGGAARKALLAETKAIERGIASLRRVATQIGADETGEPTHAEDEARALVLLENAIADLEVRALAVRRQLELYDGGLVAEAPGFASATGPQPLVVGLAVALVVGLALLSVAVLSGFVHSLAGDPERQAKFQRIRNAFRLRKPAP